MCVYICTYIDKINFRYYRPEIPHRGTQIDDRSSAFTYLFANRVCLSPYRTSLPVRASRNSANEQKLGYVLPRLLCRPYISPHVVHDTTACGIEHRSLAPV